MVEVYSKQQMDALAAVIGDRIKSGGVSLSNTVAPSIPGSGVVGSDLTCSNGDWTFAGAVAFDHRWFRNGSAIPDARSDTISTSALDHGDDFSCFVIATDENGSRGKMSNVVTVVHAAPVAAGALADQGLVLGSGVQTLDVSGDFSVATDADLSDVTWSLTTNPDPANITIDAAGVISINTDATGALSSSSIVVTATNSGGAATSGFSLDVAPVVVGTGIDLDFAGEGNSGVPRLIDKNGYLASVAGMLTFSRSGTATYFDSSGTLQVAASGAPRDQAYYWDGAAWVLGGFLLENTATTQLLHSTDSLVTQSLNVTAQKYVLHFRGTGSITLSGAHSATLNGTGANDLVSLIFVPSAGALTITPTGQVVYPQLEAGHVVTSYIPNTAASGTVTRSSESLSIGNAQMFNGGSDYTFGYRALLSHSSSGPPTGDYWRWTDGGNGYYVQNRTQFFGWDGTYRFYVNGALVSSTLKAITDGNLAVANFASRVSATETSSAQDGAFLSQSTGTYAQPDLSSAGMVLGTNRINGFLRRIRVFEEAVDDATLLGWTT